MPRRDVDGSRSRAGAPVPRRPPLWSRRAMSEPPRPESDGPRARPRHEPSKHPVVWYLALGLLLVCVAGLMLYLTRGLTFNLDEWIVVTERRGPNAPSLLAPHNEHLSILI